MVWEELHKEGGRIEKTQRRIKKRDAGEVEKRGCNIKKRRKKNEETETGELEIK